MAQRKPEDKVTLDQVLKLADQLTPEEQEKLLDQLKLEQLRRDIQIGIDQADRGELLSEEEVERRLDARRSQILERQNK